MKKGEGFSFFDGLGGTIEIETSEKPERIGTLLNLKSTPTSKLLSVKWEPHIYIEDGVRKLTKEEWKLIVFDCPTIKLSCATSNYCGDGETTEHQAPNKQYFTIRDMVQAICDNQKQTRGSTDWFGGIDVHHIFFEGIEMTEDIGIISWGS